MSNRYKSNWKAYQHLKEYAVSDEYSDKPMRPGEDEKLEIFHYRDIADYRHKFISIVWASTNDDLDKVAESIFNDVPDNHDEKDLLLEAGSIRRKELNNC